MTISEKLLLVRDGSLGFEVIDEHFRPRLFRWYSKRIPSDDLEDFVQDVLYAVLSRIKKFRDDSDATNWVGGIAENHLRGFYRKRKRRGHHESFELLFEVGAIDVRCERNDELLIDASLDGETLPRSFVLHDWLMSYQRRQVVVEKSLAV
jgi:DNA-directed RNA polymerase specialized sigma24 family protein